MNARPRRIVGETTTAAATAAAVVMIVCWIVETAWGIVVPGEVQGSATVVLVAIAGWAVRPSRGQDGSGDGGTRGTVRDDDVPLRGPGARMPEQDLDGAQIPLVRVGGAPEAVTQRVTRQRARE